MEASAAVINAIMASCITNLLKHKLYDSLSQSMPYIQVPVPTWKSWSPSHFYPKKPCPCPCPRPAFTQSQVLQQGISLYRNAPFQAILIVIILFHKFVFTVAKTSVPSYLLFYGMECPVPLNTYST